MIKKFLILLMIAILPTTSFAFCNINGYALLHYCQVALDIYDNNSGRVQTECEYMQGFKAGLCEGYIMSGEERSCFVKNSRGCPNACNSPLNSCNMRYKVALIVRYLKDHPCELGMPASVVVANAYSTYFRC